MKTCSLPARSTRAGRLLCRSFPLMLLIAVPLSAATITMTADDAGGQSSFNSGTNWTGGLAPSAANDYWVIKTLRTPATAGNYTFGGNSLTLSNTSSQGVFIYKGTANTDIITINNLIFQGGMISNATSVSTFTLAGNTTIETGKTAIFQLQNGNGGITVSSVIGGPGALVVNANAATTSQHASTINFTSANTYSGGTTISANASLTASTDGALGTGNVTLTGGKLTLQSGATSNYIANSANLIVSSGLTTGTASIVLSFTGTDVVGGISLNGGSTYLSNGLYTATQLNSLYGANIFSGSGSFSIGAIPEPSTFAMLSAMIVLGATTVLRRPRDNRSS